MTGTIAWAVLEFLSLLRARCEVEGDVFGFICRWPGVMWPLWEGVQFVKRGDLSCRVRVFSGDEGDFLGIVVASEVKGWWHDWLRQREREVGLAGYEGKVRFLAV